MIVGFGAFSECTSVFIKKLLDVMCNSLQINTDLKFHLVLGLFEITETC